MTTVWLVIRSLVLWTLSIVHFFVVCTFLVLLSLFKDPRYNDRPQRVFFRNVLRVLGVRFRVRYSPGFDPSRTALFICNHVNIFDPMVIYSAIPQFVRGMELESHFKIPAYGWMVGRFGNIPLPKKHGKAEMRELARRILAALQGGVSIIVFAEGHRTRDGRVAPFQRGIFRMATQFGYPIAPMSITGSYQLKRRNSWLLRPATIEVYLHDLVETEGLQPGDADALRDRVHQAVSRPVDSSLGIVDASAELRSYRTVGSRTEVASDHATAS
ncbi:MAG: 1-acyl-sn-glycerol-3-phosphate acyltransferase [Candidatus Latescibacterota bacterium]|nr:MAG: 1-acyl-sn-glycerol-3-phosphate acyltransferase [Candidatus Latescibacterota bacterium]